MSAVEQEWAERNHMAPGIGAGGWRFDRLLYQITLDRDAWFIDVEHSDSVATLREELAGTWTSLKLEEFTVANLRGEDRRVTTAAADWLWVQTLDDGSLPGGVRFRSKHGSDMECWAAWLRRTDDGSPRSETTKADSGSEIAPPLRNDDLKAVVDLFNLKNFH